MINKKGVDALNNILTVMEEELITNPFCNTVNIGLINEDILIKKTIYPFAHIFLNNISYPENTISFNITVINMDVVSFEKTEETVDFKNDNVLSVLTNQMYVVNRLIARIRRTNDNNDGYEIANVPQSEVIERKEADVLIGYRTDFTIVVPNDINKC